MVWNENSQMAISIIAYTSIHHQLRFPWSLEIYRTSNQAVKGQRRPHSTCKFPRLWLKRTIGSFPSTAPLSPRSQALVSARGFCFTLCPPGHASQLRRYIIYTLAKKSSYISLLVFEYLDLQIYLLFRRLHLNFLKGQIQKVK